MDLIVTHNNADFDALSSIVAASKLYPGARLLLPGSQEKAVRSFLSLVKDKIKIENEKTCRLDDVTRLVIVDNRHKSRIGVAASLLGKKGLEIHIYDHHPPTRSDIKGDKDISKEVGATVSVLLEILVKKRKLKFTPMEATLMLLGIYEETGSLSYSTTTKLDVDMVSRLLECGANLNAVSSYLNRELSGNELSALIDLLHSIDTVNINGIDIAFSHVDSDHIDGEMGTVVHKLQDVENYPVIFALFKAQDRLKILGRSRVKSVDVNKLLGIFKGAGHSSAASAKIEGVSIEKAKKDLVNAIKEMTRPKIYARDIMTFPVRTVSQEERVTEALCELERFGCKGAPVLNEDKELVGVVTLGDLKKALKSKLGHSRVKGYMSSNLVTVSPGTPLHELKDILTKQDKGRIPVIEKNKIVGIVTRTDVLKKIHSSFFPEALRRAPQMDNIADKMKEQLPGKLMSLIRTIGREADAREMNVFLVGGFVRDIFLGEKNYDLDIVVEGDAIKFGKVLADKIGGSLVTHQKFGTSTIVKPWPSWLGTSLHPDNKFKIDVATARREVYERPAALPTVKFSSLREDLYRRDFTVNAMAVSANKKNFGLFIDFFAGLEDLEKGIIRVLHDNSFIDDPTRIFRAVRFEQRFGFTIENHTEYLVTHAVKQEMFRRTENQRIRDELILILKERNPEKAVFRMKDLHELRFIHPELVIDKSIKGRFSDLRKGINWYNSHASGKRQLDTWIINLMVILEKLSQLQVEEVMKKFVLTRSASIRLRGYKKKTANALRKLSVKGKMSPSKIYRILEPLPHEVTLYAMAKTGSSLAKTRIKKFFTDYNVVKLKVKGDDIIAQGVHPGPRYKKILDQILCEKIDGKLKTKRDELNYLKDFIGKGSKKK